MTDAPRGKRPTPQERQRNIDRTGAGLGMFGGTRMAKQPPPTSRGGQSRRPSQFFATRDRITIEWSTGDVVADAGRIPSWGGYSAALDRDGLGIEFNDPTADDGRFYLFGEGLYCVTLRVIGSAVASAPTDQVVSAVAQIWDRPDTQSFSVATRGGNPSTADAGSLTMSTTFYSQGQGLASRGVEVYVEVNSSVVSADVGTVFVLAVVQKIIGFGA